MSTEHATGGWLETRLPIWATLRAALADPPLAPGRPYLASLPGLILGVLLVLAATGSVLAIYYVAAPGAAFDSIQFIRREVDDGWLLQALHASGTTLGFGALYLLLFRAMRTGGYKAPGDLGWLLAVALLALLLIAGWLGYCLTDGALSYWSLRMAALAGARPGGLGTLANWIFGGPANPMMLARMAVFHVILGLLIVAVAAALALANRSGSAAPGQRGRAVAFHPYYTSQYLVGFVILAMLLVALACFAPQLGVSLLNSQPGNPLIVPPRLTPPWYLLPFAAIGAGLPGGAGIAGVIAALALPLALPWLDRARPGPARWRRRLVWLLALDMVALALAAAWGAPALLTRLFMLWYFLHFLAFVPAISRWERT